MEHHVSIHNVGKNSAEFILNIYGEKKLITNVHFRSRVVQEVEECKKRKGRALLFLDGPPRDNFTSFTMFKT